VAEPLAVTPEEMVLKVVPAVPLAVEPEVVAVVPEEAVEPEVVEVAVPAAPEVPMAAPKAFQAAAPGGLQ